MAKSIRISEIEAQRAHSGALMSRGSFWEHWFDVHAQNHKSHSIGSLDEHSIWEKAVNLEILAMEGEKY